MKKIILSIAAMFTLATSAFAQIGSLSSDLVFTPLTPCRIVDTRVAGGTIPALATRGFKAWGTSFAAQGVNGVYTKSLDKLPICANALVAMVSMAAKLKIIFFMGFSL